MLDNAVHMQGKDHSARKNSLSRSTCTRTYMHMDIWDGSI